MASLGGLVFLEELDMAGCRGTPEDLERKVWRAIEEYRARLPVPLRQLRALRSTAKRLQERAGDHPQEHEELRRRVARILATVDRLVEAGR